MIGQARADGALDAENESQVLESALRFWALQTSTDEAAAYGARLPHRSPPRMITYPATAAQ